MRSMLGVLFVAAAVVPGAQAQQAPAQTLVVAYWKCDWAHMGTLVQRYDSLSVPINQELVDEGMLTSAGVLTHDWADEWNLVFWWLAESKEAFFSAWAEGNRRFSERHPDPPADPTFTEACGEHKDAIYNYGPATQPPGEPPPPNE